MIASDPNRRLPNRLAGLAALVGIACSAALGAPRLRSQVERILGPADTTGLGAARPLRIVLTWSVKDHGVGQHDYPRFQADWSRYLPRCPGVTVSTAQGWPSPDQWASADLVVFYLRLDTSMPAERFDQMDAFLAKGKGIAVLHASLRPNPGFEAEWAKRVGVCWKEGATGFREGPVTLRINRNAPPELVKGLPDTLMFVDEIYSPLFGAPDSIDVMAASTESGKAQPALWTYPNRGGRVFAFVMGHDYSNFDDPVFRILLLRGMAWAMAEPFARFREAVTYQADITDDPASTALRPGGTVQLRATRTPTAARKVTAAGRRLAGQAAGQASNIKVEVRDGF